MRKASILLVRIGFQETFIRAGSDGRNTGPAGSSAQRPLPDVQFGGEAPVQKWLLGVCLLNLSPVSHQEPFLAGVFPLNTRFTVALCLGLFMY